MILPAQLGQETVKDPTATEARANAEIAKRHQDHVDTNEDRKLTQEQRAEKLALNQEKDAAKGIHMLVFKVASLANGQHRFKVSKNAEQLALTGVCLMHPNTNLIVVEGGEHSITKYKKLILNRIDWSQTSPDAPATASTGEGVRLLFDGETKGRVFRKWSQKVCESDREAFDHLARVKLESFWAQAKATS
jgi:U4/U6 small nuclear ribonucleoprotein PRP3